METLFAKYVDAVENIEPIKYTGRVFRVQGLIIESRGPQAVLGEICRIEVQTGEILAEVVGIDGANVRLMSYSDLAGIEVGCRVTATGTLLKVPCAPEMLGRVLGPLGKPIDGKGEYAAITYYPAVTQALSALERPAITERINTGIRAIDGLLPVGRGQRMGIFSGSGVGKSTFQGMIARNTSADVNVIALIGERNREPNDFILNSLGEEGFKKSVVVVSTSNESAIARLRGAFVATAIAEYFRDRSMNVMLLFDSVTRFARAQREIALSAGEPVAQRGYPPSVFDILPKLLERTGPAKTGSITAFYTVLVDGDDMDEPISDNVRGILDGHVILSRRLANRGHYPAIDVLQSISRLANDIQGTETKKACMVVKRLMSDYAEAEDIINAGAYKAGSNSDIDAAIAKRRDIEEFLIQSMSDKSTLSETLSALENISGIQIPDTERK